MIIKQHRIGELRVTGIGCQIMAPNQMIPQTSRFIYNNKHIISVKTQFNYHTNINNNNNKNHTTNKQTNTESLSSSSHMLLLVVLGIKCKSLPINHLLHLFLD